MKLNGGRSGMDLRPTWDRRDLAVAGRNGDDVIVLD